MYRIGGSGRLHAILTVG